MPPREDNAVLVDGGIRRSVFFFPSGPDLLYGSTYEAAAHRGLPPVVLSLSWGIHLVPTLQFAHGLAAALAAAGGSALLYHPPGLGDSHGDPKTLTLDRLAEAAGDATALMATRTGSAPCLAGIRLGAQVVVRARARAEASSLLLLQPFVETRIALAALRSVGAGGGPTTEGEAGMEAALAGYEGPTLAVHFAAPTPGPLPSSVARVEVPGDWRRSRTRAADLAPAVLSWLRAPREGAA
jgi:hypothetical protein